ncbi:MAG: phosphatase [Gammaproteobacteria bacterium]|nr:phosphatase [Gammaproteobacteria bacterium]
MSSLETIRNYVRLTPEIATAGQLRRDQFKLISEAGFETVINIAMPDHSDSIDDEGRLVTELGMNYLHLPVSFDAPEVSHVRQFFALLSAQQGRQQFVHCIMNYRVSAFMYHYLRWEQGYSEQRARSPVFDIWEIEPQWQAIMDLDADSLNLKRN